MDLIVVKRTIARGVGPLAIALSASGCGEEFSTSSEALLLPASLSDAYSVALAVANEWADDIFVRTPGGGGYNFVQSAGGGYAVMDAQGRSHNHSFQFHSVQLDRRLVVHLFEGIPWTQDIADAVPPPPILVHFVPYEQLLDSDDVVPAAIELAALINAQFPDSIPAATDYAARLLSIPTWPEQESIIDEADSMAWRVDFLVLQEVGGQGGVTYFSNARFYIHPITGQHLGAPVVPPLPELYPFPRGFP